MSELRATLNVFIRGVGSRAVRIRPSQVSSGFVDCVTGGSSSYAQPLFLVALEQPFFLVARAVLAILAAHISASVL